MRVKSHHLAVSLFAGAIFLSGLAWVSIQVPTVQAACGTGASIAISSPTTSGGAIAGTFQLSAYSPSTTLPTGVTFAISAPTTMVIGNAQPIPNGPYVNWVFNWDTTTIPDGSYQLSAIAHYGTNPAADCNSSPLSFNVHNLATATAQTPTLVIAITPSSWLALPGQQRSFAASGTYTDQNGTKYPVGSGSTFLWDTNAGSAAPNNGLSTLLTARSVAGSYNLGVTVTMSGLTQHAVATINIAPPTTTTNTSSPTPSPSTATSPTPTPATSPQPITGVAGTAPLTAAQITTLTTTPTIFRPTTDTNAAPILPAPILGCLQEKIGTNYAGISAGTLQPTSTDRLKGLACFSGTTRIPSVLAPIAPAHIAEVPRTNGLITIGKIVNQTTTNQKGDKITAILLTGTAAPNSSLYLYFFSDPMVLRAETDSHGKWSYVLQNPLVPGKHEVYAVAAKDSTNFVRTSAMPIAVAAAADGNKSGSLVIESRWQAAQVGYVGVAALMVIAALLLLLRLVRKPKSVTGALPELVMPETPGQP